MLIGIDLCTVQEVIGDFPGINLTSCVLEQLAEGRCPVTLQTFVYVICSHKSD